MFNQGQRSWSKVDITDHCHLHRCTCTSSEIVCPNCSWYITRKSYFNVFDQGQRSWSKKEITNNCHLHRRTFTKFEVVGSNHSWDIARKSYFHVLYQPCDLEMTFDLYLYAQPQHKNELDIRKDKGYLNQIWTCLVKSETRYRSMKQWIPNCWRTNRQTDGQSWQHTSFLILRLT